MNKQAVSISILIVALLTFLYVTSDRAPNNADMIADDAPGVIARDVVYFDATTGYYAEPASSSGGPEASGEYPGVIMIHEWWGLNENIKTMARELANEGYKVLAVDLFGSVATTTAEARAQTGSLDQDKALANLRAAAVYLRSNGATKVASFGWCFGGGQSLRLSTSGEPLDATIVYYGSLITDAEPLANITWPVLGIFGAEDQSIPLETVDTFSKMLSVLEIEHQIHIYPGVGHAFANPSGANFAPEETMDAWQKTLAFLNEHLK